MRAGHYQMHRGWMDNTVFRGKFCRAAAWIWLIENAAWKPRKFDIKGRTITLQRGQLVASIRYMAEAWRWNRGAVDRYLTRLKTETMIETSTVTGETVITICNYDIYQNGADETMTADVTANVTGAGQHRDRSVTGAGQNKEGKESKEGKEGKSIERATRLPDAWTLPDEYREWALEQGWSADGIALEADKFLDYWTAAGGQRARKTKWLPTWRNWMRNAPKGQTNGKSGNNPDRTADRRREMLKGMEDAGRLDGGLRSAEGHNP